MEKFLGTVGAMVIVTPVLLVILVLGIAWRSWWLYPSWKWYIEPLGAPAISFWHFAALLFLITVTTHQSDTKKDDRAMNWIGIAINVFVIPITIWFLLWWMKP